MEKVGDLMEKLGFRKEGSDEVKVAFIKNLIKQAYGIDVELPTEEKKEVQQLSFNLEDNVG